MKKMVIGILILLTTSQAYTSISTHAGFPSGLGMSIEHGITEHLAITLSGGQLWIIPVGGIDLTYYSAPFFENALYLSLFYDTYWSAVGSFGVNWNQYSSITGITVGLRYIMGIFEIKTGVGVGYSLDGFTFGGSFQECHACSIKLLTSFGIAF